MPQDAPDHSMTTNQDNKVDSFHPPHLMQRTSLTAATLARVGAIGAFLRFSRPGVDLCWKAMTRIAHPFPGKFRRLGNRYNDGWKT